MKTIRPLHRYLLENFEDKSKPGQELQFIEKEPAGVSTALRTISDGTTNEEVISVLLDRLRGMNERLPDRNTSLAITHLEQAEDRLLRRTRERMARGVEGTMQK